MKIRFCIDKLATERGWSRNKLAETAKVNRTAVTHYWNNTIRRVDLDTLEKFADAFGISFKDLFVDNDRSITS